MSKIDLIDFGKAFEEPSKSGVFGTSYFIAPEVDAGHDASTKSDLWGLGCVILCGITGQGFPEKVEPWRTDRVPYADLDNESQLSSIEQHLLSQSILENYPNTALTIAKIVHALLQIDPVKRDPDKAKALLGELNDHEPKAERDTSKPESSRRSPVSIYDPAVWDAAHCPLDRNSTPSIG